MTEGTRVIRQEEPIKNEIPVEPSEDIFEKHIIYSTELEGIFDEWALSGKGDLVIDTELYDKLEKYIGYLEKIKPLKQKFAEVCIDKYVVNQCDVKTGSSRYIYINESLITYADMYFASNDGSMLSFIKVKDFKYLCASVGNKICTYAYKGNDEVYIDLRLWVLDLGGRMEVDYNDLKITIPQNT